MLLIYNNPATLETFGEEELKQVMGEAEAIMNELQESGEWLAGYALAHPSQARTFRERAGVPAVTDGPFTEAKEQLAGVCLFECETPERAAAIAARWPDTRYAAVELRPLMEEAGTEM